MIGLVVAISLTIILGVALLFVLATGARSGLSPRLMQVARVHPAPAETEARTTIEVVSSYTKWIAPLRKMLGLSDDEQAAKQLALAGYRSAAYVDVFYGAKLAGPLLAALVAGFVLRHNVLMWFFIIAVVGFFGPDLWLTRAISQRREKIRLAMPDAIDLLAICMEAGLGMDQALIRVGQELQITYPELSEEFLLINLEQRAGKPRIDAWRGMSERTNLEVVRSFVAMLVQTERFGTPLSKSLGNFADALRTKRRQMAEEMAAKTTIKLVFPLVCFIFPSMFIVLLGPAVISIMQNMKKVFG